MAISWLGVNAALVTVSQGMVSPAAVNALFYSVLTVLGTREYYAVIALP